MNLLKDPCLSFARDRYDVFKLLSIEDIQTVVRGGCPNLLRKSVNSAKRLRAYVHLDEGGVCSACNLRGSCERAYVVLQDTDGTAGTLDIVRILLSCALDPLVVSRGEKPSGRELAESAARKLLSELTELTEKSPDLELPKHDVRAPSQSNSIGDDLSSNVEMKRADWMCPKCNFINFDRNIRCLKCKTEGPKNVRVQSSVKKKGDWFCPGKCLRCTEQRPRRPGGWECLSCYLVNFDKNLSRLKCHTKRPKSGGAE